jgi:hypothetical protein
MKTFDPFAFAEALAPAIADATNAALSRVGADLLLEHATAEARLRDQIAPLVLPQHERRVLAALLAGEPLASFGALDAEHFYSRQRQWCFLLLREGQLTGKPLDAGGLRAKLLLSRGYVRATVDLLLEELDGTHLPLGQPLAEVAAEMIAAAAWNDFFWSIRKLNGALRARAVAFDELREAGALDVPWLQEELREACRPLAAVLKAHIREGR